MAQSAVEPDLNPQLNGAPKPDADLHESDALKRREPGVDLWLRAMDAATRGSRFITANVCDIDSSIMN